MLAALTTSIPESPDSGRNWDYRVLLAARQLLRHPGAQSAGRDADDGRLPAFIDHIVRQRRTRRLQPLITIGGDRDMPDREVLGLAGYRGMGPVSVGNGAYLQDQHDVYGAIVLATSQLVLRRAADAPGRPGAVRPAGAHRARGASTPGSNPTRGRGSSARSGVHTFSATMSWAGCDRLARIAAQLVLSARALTGAADGRPACADRLLAGCLEPRAARVLLDASAVDELDATALLLPSLGSSCAG